MSKKDALKYLLYLIIIPFSISPYTPIWIFYIIFFVLLLYTLINPKYIFLLMGSSNFLPFVFNVSPMLIIILFTIIILGLKKAKLQIKNNYFYILYLLLLWIIFSSLVNNSDISFVDEYFTGILTLFLVFILVNNRIVSIKNATTFLLLGLMVNISIGLFSVLNFFGLSSFDNFRLTFSRGDSNSVGLSYAFVVVVFSTMILVSLKNHDYTNLFTKIVVLAVSLYLLLLTGSRGSILSVIIAFIISLLFLLLLKRKRFLKNQFRNNYLRAIFLITTLISILLLTIIYFNSINDFLYRTFEYTIIRFSTSFEDDSRAMLYRYAIDSIKTSPLFGIGIAKYTIISGGLLTHNSYLDYLVSAGIIGFLLYMIFIILLYSKSLKLILFKMPYLFPFFMGTVAVSFNQFTYSSVGDKLLWIPLGIFISILSQYKSSERCLQD